MNKVWNRTALANSGGSGGGEGMEKSELDKQIDEMMDAWYREHPDDDRDWLEIVVTPEFSDWTNREAK